MEVTGDGHEEGIQERERAARVRLRREESAQATLEYALVVAAFMAMVSALALLWRAGADGVLARLVEDAASHALDGLGVLDIVLY